MKKIDTGKLFLLPGTWTVTVIGALPGGGATKLTCRIPAINPGAALIALEAEGNEA